MSEERPRLSMDYVRRKEDLYLSLKDLIIWCYASGNTEAAKDLERFGKQVRRG